MKFSKVLQNHVYWSVAHGHASRARTAWLCSCGLQDGYDVSRLFRILPDAQVLIGVPVKDDTARDLERSRNAIRFAQRAFSKIRFREHVLVHYKFHIFYPKDPAEPPSAFVGSLNLTSNRWDELMIEVDYATTEELQSLFEGLWRKAKEVKPHPKTYIKDLETRVVRGAFSSES